MTNVDAIIIFYLFLLNLENNLSEKINNKNIFY